MHQQSTHIQTQGRGFYDITDKIQQIISQQKITTGLCHVFCQHTSASLIITENCDPDVRKDTEGFLSRLVKDGDPCFYHILEGKDDMSAHIRTVLTGESKTIPIIDSELGLGTWQGLYLYEHRYQPHNRKIIVTLS
ncbi:secondary thiamine-phosphate synthase enzyme YjbQ [Francisellaceae bacterium]|nr:secondary thiamine-phosphate synthase enzyme YjbQ [Francisellaceae bacterium]